MAWSFVSIMAPQFPGMSTLTHESLLISSSNAQDPIYLNPVHLGCNHPRTHQRKGSHSLAWGLGAYHNRNGHLNKGSQNKERHIPKAWSTEATYRPVVGFHKLCKNLCAHAWHGASCLKIPAIWGLRWMDPWEFQSILGYEFISRPLSTTT